MMEQEIYHAVGASRFRQKGLIAKKLGDELLLYDEETNTAHCLNEIAGEMWMACEVDGSAVEITKLLHSRLPGIEEEAVLASLHQMARTGLLEESTDKESVSLSRRALIRKFGITAAAVVPIVVTTLLIPSAAAAASPCGTLLKPCGGTNPPCCTGFHCVLGFCEQLL